MIIGSGLIARSFSKLFNKSNKICIFASGVSNSMCQDTSQFNKEKQILNKTLKEFMGKGKFVYFGTCSSAFRNNHYNDYINHKLEMENLVLNYHDSVIFRLPQIIGPGGNQNNLINFLYNSISFEIKFEIWKNASRNILDIEDVVLIVDYFLKNIKTKKKIINIASPLSYRILDIVSELEKHIGKKAIYEIKNKGFKQIITIPEIYPIIEKLEINFDQFYLSRVIKKYFDLSKR